MENQELSENQIDVVLNYVDSYLEDKFPQTGTKVTTEMKYTKDIEKVISLLSASVVYPTGEGAAEVKFLISDKDNRIELENYVMNLTRKNLSKKIEVNKVGW